MIKDISKIKYYENILGTIGNTPLVKINRINAGLKPKIFAKIEFFNPGGSVKDRIGVAIIEDAERCGKLKPGGTIIEATSGNTGLGLAIAAAIKGYKTIFTLPDKMSMEKIRFLRAFGSEVIVTPTAVPHESPESYTSVAEKLSKEIPNSILANQYYNPKNYESHYKTTGPEIWEQTGGQIDYFICGMGTGGTITGVAKFLKEKNPNIKVIGVDPVGSGLMEYFQTKVMPHITKTYKVEGIGQDFIPDNLDFNYIDDCVQADDKESFIMARRLTREEGIFSGGSAGTAMAGALKYCATLPEDAIVVVLLPDGGDKYVSKIYNDDWMKENGFLTPERITLKYIIESKSKQMPQVVFASPSDTVKQTLDLITKFNISQLPVFENEKNLGVVSEGNLLSSVLENITTFDEPINKLLEPPLPQLHLQDELTLAIEQMAKKNHAVLVTDGNKIVGIVTRFDVLEYLTK